MIMSCSYSNSHTSDKSSYLSPFSWSNFIALALVLYMSHCLLHNEVALLEFTYKEISMAYVIGNIYITDYTKFPEIIPWLNIL